MSEELHDLSIGVGMLSEEQVASQLPFETPGNALLLTRRLVARRSLKSVPLGNTVRIPLAELTKFMADGAQNSAVRAALNLPMETLSPIFPLGTTNERNWFGPGPAEFEWSMWKQTVSSALAEQFPKRIRFDPATDHHQSAGNEGPGRGHTDAGARRLTVPKLGGISPGQAPSRVGMVFCRAELPGERRRAGGEPKSVLWHRGQPGIVCGRTANTAATGAVPHIAHDGDLR